MNLDFFEILGFISDALNAFGSDSSSSNNEKPKINKKRKYFIEKISAVFLAIASVLLLFVFKELPSENYVQTIVVASLIGFAISLLFFFFLYVIEIYYFKNVFQWLFFSCSIIISILQFLKSEKLQYRRKIRQ